MKSILIKDTTREERAEIVKRSITCGNGCENCDGCALGAGDVLEMYQPYIDGEKRFASAIWRTGQGTASTEHIWLPLRGSWPEGPEGVSKVELHF